MIPAREILEKLYIAERLTTRAIGARFGVSKTSVIRWLKRYEMPRRLSGRHLGIAIPSRAELYAMIHERHMSYREIADLYGASVQPIVDWITAYGIPRPTLWQTRRKGRVVVMPTPDALRSYYSDGYSLEHIAEMHGVSEWPIRRLARSIGLEVRPNGWKQGKRWICSDGHAARSTYELRVDNWLHDHGILHRPEPRIPHTAYWRADSWADGWYIEIWGVINRPSYRQRKEEKRAHYRAHQIPLIELSPHDFSSRSPTQWAQKLDAALGSGPVSIPA